MVGTIVFSSSIFCHIISFLHLCDIYLGIVNFGCLVAFNKFYAIKKIHGILFPVSVNTELVVTGYLDLNLSAVIEGGLTRTNVWGRQDVGRKRLVGGGEGDTSFKLY